MHFGNYSAVAADELYWLCREVSSLGSSQTERCTTGSKGTDPKQTLDNPQFG
jgi:hypothetical protein